LSQPTQQVKSVHCTQWLSERKNLCGFRWFFAGFCGSRLSEHWSGEKKMARIGSDCLGLVRNGSEWFGFELDFNAETRRSQRQQRQKGEELSFRPGWARIAADLWAAGPRLSQAI